MCTQHRKRANRYQNAFNLLSEHNEPNTAAAQLAPLADYLDLDSHLNFIDDPFIGAVMKAGRLLPKVNKTFKTLT